MYPGIARECTFLWHAIPVINIKDYVCVYIVVLFSWAASITELLNCDFGQCPLLLSFSLELHATYYRCFNRCFLYIYITSLRVTLLETIMMCSLYCIVLLNAILYTPVHYKHDKSNHQIGTLPKINLLKPCKIAQSAMFHTL